MSPAGQSAGQSGPGLDMDALRALHGRQRRKSTSPTGGQHDRGVLERIAAHLQQHDGYVAFSGGKDSTAVLHLALQVDPAVPVAWFDSGLELPETRAYIDQLADTWALNLTVVPADPTALQLLIASGAWDHIAPPARVPRLGKILIEEPAAKAHLRFGPGELWGVRSQEAAGRRQMYATRLRREIALFCHGCCPADPTGAPTRAQRATHGGIVRRGDGTTAYGPVWDWTTTQVWEYLAVNEIPANPVYAKLRALGGPRDGTADLHRPGRWAPRARPHYLATPRLAPALRRAAAAASASGRVRLACHAEPPPRTGVQRRYHPQLHCLAGPTEPE